jgi:hypothetical protein
VAVDTDAAAPGSLVGALAAGVERAGAGSAGFAAEDVAPAPTGAVPVVGVSAPDAFPDDDDTDEELDSGAEEEAGALVPAPAEPVVPPDALAAGVDGVAEGALAGSLGADGLAGAVTGGADAAGAEGVGVAAGGAGGGGTTIRGGRNASGST